MIIATCLCLVCNLTTMDHNGAHFLDEAQIARARFGNDAPWYEANIPFFACSDPELEKIYYYRWQLYKAHIRDLGAKGSLITEFLDDVPWQKHPYAMLNDATPFHLYEGRWMRNQRVIRGFLDFLYRGGGNDRHFAEGIADAAYAVYLANGDAASVTPYLGSMQQTYNLWDDHYDFSKGLYFIEPLLDATEYTISSIDASGGKDGFRGGDAFRPTINAYMYGNALAISRIADLAGQPSVKADYAKRAADLKTRIQDDLWNPKLQHFTDRYFEQNEHVHYWDFIRGREIAGYVPWAYGLPDDNPTYAQAWTHLIDPNEFAGPYAIRTVGPGYEYYMKQYRYLGSQPECQWNGPSWPFQTTQVLRGMANLLNDYHQNVVTAEDYLRLLHQYAEQHELDGRPNLQEDYNADTGKPIVGLDRSHHYNHSGFVDLIVTGLCGIHPRAGDALEIAPLMPADGKGLAHFLLQDVPYHGHLITVMWDRDGTIYAQGPGLSVFVDGRRSVGPVPLGKVIVNVGKTVVPKTVQHLDLALNIYRHGYPTPSASVNEGPTVWQSVDGRTWYFPEMVRGWSTEGTNNSSDWFAIDFGKPAKLQSAILRFQGAAPQSVQIEALHEGAWAPVTALHGPATPLAGGDNVYTFAPIEGSQVRFTFVHDRPIVLVEAVVHAPE